MKKILLILTIIFITTESTGAYQANEFLEDYSNGSEGEKEYLYNYITGITRGAVATNILSAAENGKRIFCPPPKFIIDGEVLLGLIPDFKKDIIEGNSKFKNEELDYPLFLFVPMVLVHTYPCN
jgi:hypothetical protein